MKTNNETLSDTQASDIVITRVFQAPVSLVWKVWTDPAHFMKWWGPRDFTSPACKMDLRVGGKYLFGMQGPDGARFWSTGVFKEIEPMKKISFTDAFSDKEGNKMTAAQMGIPGEWPDEMLVTITFEDQGAKTRMTLCHSAVPGHVTDMTRTSWNESFDKLGYSMDAGTGTSFTTMSETTMQMSRVFDAPRELVFKAMTDPKSIPHWWGPGYMTTTVDKMDVRTGGSYRYVQRKEGKPAEYAFRGDYLEVEPPSRVVSTFEFEMMPGKIMTETMVLVDLGNNKTRMTVTSSLASKEDKEGLVNSGMEAGAVESWDRLATHLTTM